MSKQKATKHDIKENTVQERVTLWGGQSSRAKINEGGKATARRKKNFPAGEKGIVTFLLG